MCCANAQQAKNRRLTFFLKKTEAPNWRHPPCIATCSKSLALMMALSDRRLKAVFHALRRAFASWLAQDDVPLFAVSKLTGHASIQANILYYFAKKLNSVRKFF
ncbi:MAG: tyrosine-type recombinase/integrase [Deltaproteobacteria bacterium]|nr:tyrosine-type recombinase/integrase [Deltaproteobacteria bacterium]